MYKMIKILVLSSFVCIASGLKCYNGASLTGLSQIASQNTVTSVTCPNATNACLLLKGHAKSWMETDRNPITFGECVDSSECSKNCSTYRDVVSVVHFMLRLADPHLCKITCCTTDNCNVIPPPADLTTTPMMSSTNSVTSPTSSSVVPPTQSATSQPMASSTAPTTSTTPTPSQSTTTSGLLSTLIVTSKDAQSMTSSPPQAPHQSTTSGSSDVTKMSAYLTLAMMLLHIVCKV